MVAELREHLVGRSLQRFATHDGANGDDLLLASAQCFADARHGENWADADERIAGADDDSSGVPNGLEYSGCGARGVGACKTNAAHEGLGAPLHQILLEMQSSLVCV